MRHIPGFWHDAPPDPVPVEPLWQDFVRTTGGLLVQETLPEPRAFENADFAFPQQGVILELKEVETEFSATASFRNGFQSLMTRLLAEQPEWRPYLFGGDGRVPGWFNPELVRLCRLPLSRVLKKANRQLRQTKNVFGLETNTGVLILVNDGFTSISPHLVQAQVSELLLHSYSAISCCVYQTINRYIEFPGDPEPKLLWAAAYAETAPDSLVAFIDDLGRKWADFLEDRLGPYTSRAEVPSSEHVLLGTSAIRLPGE
jgi:hypothetical protein